MNQQQGPFSEERYRAAANWFVLIIRSFAFSVEVFLRRDFGERYIGIQAALALLLIAFFPIFCAGHDVAPLVNFLFLYMFMCLCARVGIARRAKRGVLDTHSRYSGWPRLMKLFPRATELGTKRIGEPLLVFMISFFVFGINAPLGSYLMIAGVALFLSCQLNNMYDRVQALDMNDAIIEATQRAERFRDQGGQ